MLWYGVVAQVVAKIANILTISIQLLWYWVNQLIAISYCNNNLPNCFPIPINSQLPKIRVKVLLRLN